MPHTRSRSWRQTWLKNIQSLPLARFIRFGIVGFSGLFVDMAVFFLLRENTHLNWRLCTAISIEAAIVNNFLWNDTWTFADLAQQQQGQQARIKRLLKFNLVCLSGALLQYVLTEGLLQLPYIATLPLWFSQVLSLTVVNIDEYVAKIIAIALVIFWNFWINLKLSWRISKQRPQKTKLQKQRPQKPNA